MRQSARMMSVALCAFAITSTASAQQYRFSDLGVVPGGNNGAATAINNNGSVVGYGYVDPYMNSSATSRATLWNGAGATNLGSALTGSTATAINDSNVAVGWSSNAGFPSFDQATVWTGNRIDTLGSLGGSSSAAFAINNSGVVAGYAWTAPGVGGLYGTQHASLWTNGQVTDLGTLTGGSVSLAYGINDSGLVVGTSDSAKTGYRATLWRNGVITQLANLGGNQGYAYAINSNGQIAGISDDGIYGNRAVTWSLDGSLSLLDTLGGHTSNATDINNFGDIVGWSTTLGSYSSVATLWHNGQAIDLNSLLDPSSADTWDLTNASSINDAGSIVGQAVNQKTGEAHAFLLSYTDTPVSSVPAPPTYILLLSGLSLLFITSRRRMAV